MDTQPTPEWVVLAKHVFAPVVAAIPGMLSRMLATRIVDKSPITWRDAIYRISMVAVFGMLGGAAALYFNLHYLVGCAIAALLGNCGGQCLKIWRHILINKLSKDTLK